MTMISSFMGKTFTNEILEELAGFILMNKPMQIELEGCYGKKLHKLIKEEAATGLIPKSI